MFAKWGIWAGLTAVIVVALMFGGAVSAAAAPPPPATYTVIISEQGLPSGYSWSATFDSVLGSSSTSTIKFTGVPALSQYFYPSTIAGPSSTTQYVPTYSYYYVTVPNILRVSVVYQTEFYTTFGVSPSGSGSVNYGTNWYDASSLVPIAASANPGYTFTGWVVSSGITVAKSSLAATELTMGAAGTVTADFTANTYSTTFQEVGLPASTHWTVVFDSGSKSSTTTSLVTSPLGAGNYYWSIAPVTSGATTEYVASPADGYVNMPYQLSQEVVFTTEYAVTFAVTGSGSVTPASGYYPSHGNVTLQASSSSELFSKWTTTASKVHLGSTANAGTNATVDGSTTVTAVFKSGKFCTSACALTFREVGLPASTAWGVTFGGINYGSSGTSIALTGISAAESWTAYSPVGTTYGIAYVPIGTSVSGTYYLGYETSIEVVYEKVAYLTFQDNPSSLPGGGGAYTSAGPGAGYETLGSAWIPVGMTFPLSAYNGSYYSFASWTSSGLMTVGSAAAASTTFELTGPATLTENFVELSNTLHIIEYGLPTGTAWGVELAGPFDSLYTSTTNWVNITGVPSYGYTVYSIQSINAGTGAQWDSPLTAENVYPPGQTYVSFVYAEEVHVTFVTAPTGAAGTILTPATGWYYVGTVLPLIADNATSGTNPTFKAWSQTTGTGTLVSTSMASTYLTVLKTGTVTCTFK